MTPQMIINDRKKCVRDSLVKMMTLHNFLFLTVTKSVFLWSKSRVLWETLAPDGKPDNGHQLRILLVDFHEHRCRLLWENISLKVERGWWSSHSRLSVVSVTIYDDSDGSTVSIEISWRKVNKKIAQVLNSITNCDELFPCELRHQIFRFMTCSRIVAQFLLKVAHWSLKPVASDDFLLRLQRWKFWFLFNLLLTIRVKKCILFYNSASRQRIGNQEKPAPKDNRRIHENSKYQQCCMLDNAA